MHVKEVGSTTCGLKVCAAGYSLSIRKKMTVTQTLSWWDVPGMFQCRWDVPGRFQSQPFIVPSFGTMGCDLEPAFGSPRNHHTNRKSQKVKKMIMYLVLSWYQHASERGMIHLVFAAQFIPVQFLCCFPFFFWAQTQKIMSIIFHVLPCFPAYPPLTLKESKLYRTPH